MDSRRIDFSFNWNNKLDCVYFTTLRLHNPSKYAPNNVHSVYLKDEFLFDATIQSVKSIYGKDLNPFICGLDTGYSVSVAKGILANMYKKTVLEIEQEQFSFVLYKRLV